jgi:hypothetical protein
MMLLACEKEDAAVEVRYQVYNAFAETEITFRNGDKQVVTESVTFESVEDSWNYSMESMQGDIVYLSARYSDTASSVKLRIIIDGKTYKEGSSNNEPEKFVTISGTVPYQ